MIQLLRAARARGTRVMLPVLLALGAGVMPGRSYQLESAAGVPSGFWSNVSGSLTTAGPLQLELGHTASLATNPPVQFYRVKLLP
jgi:hypothetical protein